MASGLTTTVLYSPLHIDSMTHSKSPTLQVQHDEPMEDPPERSVFCRVSFYPIYWWKVFKKMTNLLSSFSLSFFEGECDVAIIKS